MIAATWVVLSAVAGVDEMVSMRAMERAFFADERAAASPRASRCAVGSSKGRSGAGRTGRSRRSRATHQGHRRRSISPGPRTRVSRHTFASSRGGGRRTFQHWLDRSAVFIPKLRPILEEVGLPQDLVYLAMIESGFRQCCSRAGAQGVWQFIPATARSFGLKPDILSMNEPDLDQATRAAAALPLGAS